MAGLSMDGLVAKLKNRLSKAAISKYEQGKMMPSSNYLIALADALGVSVDFFFTSREINIQDLNFRKNQSLKGRVLESVHEKIRDSLERYLELEDLLGISPSFKTPLYDFIVKNVDDIEEAAHLVREAWAIGPEAPVSFLLNVLEQQGILVIELEINPELKFDGASGFVNQRPFIVLDKYKPADRKRLSALHELAHLCLPFSASLSKKEQEKLCHAFGSAFLLPAQALRNELGQKRRDISLQELSILKQRYGISMQAIMYRSRTLGIISESAYLSFCKDINSRGWRKCEPINYPLQEEAHRFTMLLYRALEENIITIAKASYLSGKSIQDLEKELNLYHAVITP
jgi:Zn-dependent peptidase ImmA (M78 family)